MNAILYTAYQLYLAHFRFENDISIMQYFQNVFAKTYWGHTNGGIVKLEQMEWEDYISAT